MCIRDSASRSSSAPSTPPRNASRAAACPGSPGHGWPDPPAGPDPLPEFSPLPAAGPPGFSGDATPRAEHTDEAPPPAP
eukprot:7628862-Alexandrium_andersonii.AAC.1